MGHIQKAQDLSKVLLEPNPMHNTSNAIKQYLKVEEKKKKLTCSRCIKPLKNINLTKEKSSSSKIMNYSHYSRSLHFTCIVSNVATQEVISSEGIFSSFVSETSWDFK